MSKNSLFSYLSAVLASAVLLQTRSVVAHPCHNDDEDASKPQPAAYHPNESMDSHRLPLKDLKRIQAWMSYWNSTGKRHFTVIRHEEDSTLELRCLDCEADELDSAYKFLAAPGNADGGCQ